MAEPDSLQMWRSHPQDYVVICRILNSAEGEGVTYHIVNITKKLTHSIEKQSSVRKLAQEMLDAGVRLVTMEEAKQLLNRQKTGESGQ